MTLPPIVAYQVERALQRRQDLRGNDRQSMWWIRRATTGDAINNRYLTFSPPV